MKRCNGCGIPYGLQTRAAFFLNTKTTFKNARLYATLVDNKFLPRDVWITNRVLSLCVSVFTKHGHCSLVCQKGIECNSYNEN